MAVASSSPGCLVYFFLAALTMLGYLPLGRHGADFSADSKRLAYKYNESEVRIRNLETGASSAPLYTAPEGWILNSIHWSEKTGMIYAVAHEEPMCSERGDEGKWVLRLVSIDPSGGVSRTLTERSYHCLKSQFEEAGLDSETPEAAPLADYQRISSAVSFKPSGWDSGVVYFIEPEDFTKRKPAVRKMDLLTGAESQAFELPEGAYSHMLSPSAQYLVSLTHNEAADQNSITLYLRRAGSQDILFSKTLARLPCIAPGDCEEPGAGLWVLSGAEGAAAFDENAGLMFFVSLDPDKPGTELHALDLNTMKTRLLHTSFDITFFLPVPQKKALLIATETPAAMALFDIQNKGADGFMDTGFKDFVKTQLISYEGKGLKQLKSAPPLLSAYMNAVRPDVALSADGRFVALTAVNMFSDEAPPKGLGEVRPMTIPAILDLEKDAFEFIITEPIDNALAGMLLHNLGYSEAAVPHLKALPRSLWGQSKLTRSAVFALLAAQRAAGKTAEAQDIYAALLEQLKPFGDPRMLMATGYYTTVSRVEPFRTGIYFRALKLEDLPAFGDPVTAEDRAFIRAELEASQPSWKTDLMLAGLAVHDQQWDAASDLIQSALEQNNSQAPDDEKIASADFLRAQILEKAGRYEQALALYENSSADLKEIALATAPVYEKLGRFEEAAQAYSFLVGALKKELKTAEAECVETPEPDCRDRTDALNEQIKQYTELRNALREKAN